jgi:hypothetical protein
MIRKQRPGHTTGEASRFHPLQRKDVPRRGADDGGHGLMVARLRRGWWLVAGGWWF